MRAFTIQLYHEFERQANEYVALRMEFDRTVQELDQTRDALLGALKLAEESRRRPRPAARP